MFSHIDLCCAQNHAFRTSPETEGLFFEAMKEQITFHWTRQPFLQALGKRWGWTPDRLQKPGDELAIPPLFVGVMKREPFCSLPQEEIALTLTSSGTGGEKTMLLMDDPSLNRLQNLSEAVFRDIGFCSEVPAHALLFSYAREDAAEIGTSWSDEQLLNLTPLREVHWLLHRDNRGDFTFDAEKTAELLRRLAPTGPIRFIGFPAFIHSVLEIIRQDEKPLKLDPQSFVLAGGGWKTHSGTPMTHRDFALQMEEVLGIPRQNVRDVYGMAEHGVPYCACSEGHHHVPVFSRLVVRHPLTLEALPLGTEGLLHLYTPYNTAQPNGSVLSTDMVVLKEQCPCGLPGPYIASIRRGGTKKHKGCAIAAQDILDKMQRKESSRS